MTGERIAIESQPQPVGFIGWVTGLLPQRAWLEGSKLTVERRRGASQCDLATASQVGLHSVPPLQAGALLVLYAYQEQSGSAPVRLVVAHFIRSPVTADGLRTLARIIGSRPAEPGRMTSKIVRQLNALAMDEDRRNKPIDWTFRTGPQDYRRPANE